MFVFQSIFAGFATYYGSKKIKFHRGIFQTEDQAVANHLRKEHKGVVIEITEKKPVAEKPAEEKPAKKAQEADKASK